MKKIKFVRYGNLNVQKYDKKIDDEFHKPPVKYGIFAFVWPYIEPYLYYWKTPNRKENESDKDFNKRINKWLRDNRKEFEYSGYLWIHDLWISDNYNIEGIKSGTWVKIHTNDLPEIFKKIKHRDLKSIMISHKKYFNDQSKISPIDPYKRGLDGNMSMDHLEVFIEKIK